MKIRHKITLWVAGAGFLTSLVLSLVVFLEMRKQPLKFMDSDLRSRAAALAKRLSPEQRPVEEKRANALLVQENEYWIKVYSEKLGPIFL